MKDLGTINNALFFMLDISDGLMSDIEKHYGMEMKHEIKREFNKAVFHLSRFLSVIKKINIEEQCSFGLESDMLKELIFLAIDRDNDGEYIQKLIDTIKLTKSVHNFDFKKIDL